MYLVFGSSKVFNIVISSQKNIFLKEFLSLSSRKSSLDWLGWMECLFCQLWI